MFFHFINCINKIQDYLGCKQLDQKHCPKLYKNFSPDFLFITGDTNPRSQMLNTGQLYYLDAIFLVLGIIYILKKKIENYIIF